ncbi:uncharacterized protein LOC120208164 [Hibiscus syriacus]|uniref:uncharacterized protein LOC120208164 n=1 Tax=Hibiscus syriacus TaxID=106335 RepID=UPI001923B5DF|nr:uncharacterized protein LOC120208164 [Hibiscus syriacus]
MTQPPRYEQEDGHIHLFVRKTEDRVVYLLVYVDDIILTGSYADEVHTVVNKQNAQLSLKDLGSLSFFLWIEVCYGADGFVDHGLKFTPSQMSVTGLIDANWGSDVDDRLSTSGFMIAAGKLQVHEVSAYEQAEAVGQTIGSAQGWFRRVEQARELKV